MVDQQATSAEPKATDSTATSYLNTENIARSNAGIEYHPLRPFLPENARVLFVCRAAIERQCIRQVSGGSGSH